MKLFFQLFFILLTPQFAEAQFLTPNYYYDNSLNTVTVFGEVVNPKGNKVYVRNLDKEVIDSSILDSNGNFAMTFSWLNPYPAEFFHEGYSAKLYLLPGDSLKLNIDTRSFDKFHTVIYKKVIKLAVGKAAPVFKYSDINGKLVSLSDFKGKIVYLDIWASWCAPCRDEIPHSKKLEEEMKGLNIVFLYISIDSDENAWENIIKKKEMTGVHLISNGGFDSDITKLYDITGIPHYFIIDKDGKFINLNANRPSRGVKKELMALVK